MPWSLNAARFMPEQCSESSIVLPIRWKSGGAKLGPGSLSFSKNLKHVSTSQYCIFASAWAPKYTESVLRKEAKPKGTYGIYLITYNSGNHNVFLMQKYKRWKRVNSFISCSKFNCDIFIKSLFDNSFGLQGKRFKSRSIYYFRFIVEKVDGDPKSV